MKIIGIDFDNTVACYSDIFLQFGNQYGANNLVTTDPKVALKKALQQYSNGEVIWQKIQGQVYGRLISQAKLHSGVLEFLGVAFIRRYSVNIVSHKTVYGHYDDSMVNLHKVAREWLIEKLCALNPCLVDSIYFETNQDKKIERIGLLSCDYFIDDLIEIFKHPNFPKKSKKILFSVIPNLEQNCSSSINFSGSWAKIQQEIFGEISPAEILKLANIFFPKLLLNKIFEINHTGNSSVYKIISRDSKKYFLKRYPDLSVDPRKRLEVEVEAVKFLFLKGLKVPQYVNSNKELNWCIFEWKDGERIEVVNERILNEAINFIQSINIERNDSSNIFGLASEACLSDINLFNQIDKRLSILLNIDCPALKDFLAKDFIVSYEAAKLAYSNSLKSYSNQLSEEFRVLSPSDFGVNNMMVDHFGTVIFFDFEYFGWDDPVKLSSDFYWHPSVNLNEDLKNYWIDLCIKSFCMDPNFGDRLRDLLPFYGFRWCLIILNVFKTRSKSLEISDNEENQLKKSKEMLSKINGLIKKWMLDLKS